MRTRALSAVIWSGVEQIGANGLSTLFMLAFARVLSPADFGNFTSASLMTGFGGLISMLGMRSLVIQRSNIDDRFLSTVFWLCVGLSCVVSAVLISIGEAIGQIFGNPELASLLPYLCLAMIISVVTGLHTAQLHRELDLRRLARRTLLANVVAGSLALPFAFYGYGAYSLLVQLVGGVALTAVLLISMLGWPFKFVFDLKMAREAISFGSRVSMADLIIYYDRESPKLFVGAFFGAEQLGIFSMALRIQNLLVNTFGMPLANLAAPIISDMRRSGRKITNAYIEMVSISAAILIPLFSIIAAFPNDTVVILLGKEWLDAAKSIGVLSIVGLLLTLSLFNGSVLVASGDPASRLSFASVSALVGTIGMWVAAPLGLVGVASALLLRSALIEPWQTARVLRTVELSMRTFAGAIWPALWVTAAVVGLVKVWTASIKPLNSEVVAFMVMPTLFLACVILIITIDSRVKNSYRFIVSSFNGRTN